ncbi:MAG: aminoacetone oxidase family FAD-binding enzyme [Bacilli bacterium]
MEKVLIIGAGASGLTCAIIKRRAGYDVTVLEKNKNIGKKLLMTGNGKCNYLNEDFSLNHYRSNNIEKLKNIITDENKKLILDFFESLGIIGNIKNGYYYPTSNQAITICNALELEAKNLGVKIINDVNILKIENNFTVKTNKEDYKTDQLIIATGSNASIKTPDNIGYNIAKQFGHSIIKPLPALVQLKTEIKDWAGVKTNAIVSLYENGKLIKKEEGELQLNNGNISGICIFQLSSIISKGIETGKRETIKINFTPWCKSKEELIDYIIKTNKKLKNRNVANILDNILNWKLGNTILKLTGIKEDDLVNNINLEKLAKNIFEFELNITETLPLENAQVASGGIPLNEINMDNFESLKCKDLYFIGEILDVDGDCGGYNLGFAWISGIKGATK